MWKSNNLDQLQLNLLEQNIILIGGEVDGDMAFYVRESLLRLTAKSHPDITVIITSDGGNAEIGLDIYDMLRIYSGKITGIVQGYARSSATIIDLFQNPKSHNS